METKELTSQYRAHVTLPDNTTCSITGENLNNVKESIQRLVDGKARFDQSDQNNIQVFHPAWGKGQTPLGYINHVRVPISLGVASLVETRAAQAA